MGASTSRSWNRSISTYKLRTLRCTNADDVGYCTKGVGAADHITDTVIDYMERHKMYLSVVYGMRPEASKTRAAEQLAVVMAQIILAFTTLLFGYFSKYDLYACHLQKAALKRHVPSTQ